MDDEAPRKPRGNAWLTLLGLTVFVYLVLWAGTFAFGVRGVRELREGFPLNMACPMIPIEKFDPAFFPPPVPDDELTSYYFVGHTFSPCPFVISFDLAAMSKRDGAAYRMYAFWFFTLKNPFHEKTYWKYGQ